MDGFHFLRPDWLAAIPLWLALVIWVRRSARADSSWVRICDPRLLPFVVDTEGRTRSALFYPLAALAGLLVLTALAGPVWRELPQPVYRGKSALVIALDLSASMETADVDPSRLVVARHKILDLLHRRVDGQTALVAYAGDAFVVTPLTDDTRTIAAMLPSLDPGIMPAPGTRTDRAIDRARRLLEQAGAPRGRVLLVTDSESGPDIDQALERLNKAGYTLSVIGVGTPAGAPIPSGNGYVKDNKGNIVLARLDEPALEALALKGGGVYARCRLDDADLRKVLAPGRGTGAGAVRSSLKTDRWREEGPWLLPLVLLLVLPLFRRGTLE
ncbi:MAG: VWA domain-containing protein [Arenicellales bacterium]